MKKDDSKIITKLILDNLIRRLEYMGKICDNALDNNSSLEQRQKKFKEIQAKYTDCITERLNQA